MLQTDLLGSTSLFLLLHFHLCALFSSITDFNYSERRTSGHFFTCFAPVLRCPTLSMKRDSFSNCLGPSKMPCTMMTGLYPSTQTAASSCSSSGSSSGSRDAGDPPLLFISSRAQVTTSGRARPRQGTADRPHLELMRSSAVLMSDYMLIIDPLTFCFNLEST